MIDRFTQTIMSNGALLMGRRRLNPTQMDFLLIRRIKLLALFELQWESGHWFKKRTLKKKSSEHMKKPISFRLEQTKISPMTPASDRIQDNKTFLTSVSRILSLVAFKDSMLLFWRTDKLDQVRHGPWDLVTLQG